MLDLDFQGQTNFFQICIIFKVSHHSYIIYFKSFEFLDIDYVKINTKIKSDSMYSARDNEGHSKVCLTLILEVNCGGQVTNVSHFELPNIGYN